MYPQKKLAENPPWMKMYFLLKMAVISARPASFPWKNPWIFNLKGKKRQALNFVRGGTFGGVHLYGDKKWNRSRFVGFEPSSCGICSDVFLIFFALVFWRRGLKGGAKWCAIQEIIKKKLQINSSPLKDDGWKMTFFLKWPLWKGDLLVFRGVAKDTDSGRILGWWPLQSTLHPHPPSYGPFLTGP